jgi:hypothetical protein
MFSKKIKLWVLKFFTDRLSRSDKELEENRIMPSKTDEWQLPDDATAEEIAAHQKLFNKKCTVP